MSIWWTYILRCADGSLYAGATNDWARRLRQHNAGTAARYTRGRGPVALVYLEPCGGQGDALRREAQLKRLPASRKRALCAEPL